MSSLAKPEESVQQQATNPSVALEEAAGQAGVIKRPVADDDIQFVSSNPVKKRRMTEQKPAQTTDNSMAPPPAPTVKHLTPTIEQISPVDRSRSLCGIGQAKGPLADAMLETRGASLPVLENFAFPQVFPGFPNQPSRFSVAVSPRQLPQAFATPSEADADANQPVRPAPGHAAQDSVTLDQISCLDFHGVPLNTPGFNLSQVFPADGGIMGGFGLNSTGGSTSARPNPLNAHNTIPFTMYSTGNIVTLPQTNGAGQPPPACLHCARLRQEHLLRQAQLVPGDAAQDQPPPSSQQHLCRPPSPTPLALPTLRPIPRSTPANIHPRQQQQEQQQQQHLPTAQCPAPATMPAPLPLRSGPALNLVQDIAHTVQSCFPYAQVAARHGMAPARVVEVVSGVVVRPLLRGVAGERAVGGRHHGS
ncbi:hypothetical protein N658DRAFT_517447 [Parathielavia hyrcaniae]|uniref:Uncharacterized protein n=1 Tax=Parathielavia hyrcaniae TaxID=113614 RepID=A0AAN6PWQ9_9PEZI|nr:hypothetical protein N658DRAFT_517447 [Parathielavia hyrcaniae]